MVLNEINLEVSKLYNVLDAPLNETSIQRLFTVHDVDFSDTLSLPEWTPWFNKAFNEIVWKGVIEVKTDDNNNVIIE